MDESVMSHDRKGTGNREGKGMEGKSLLHAWSLQGATLDAGCRQAIDGVPCP